MLIQLRDIKYVCLIYVFTLSLACLSILPLKAFAEQPNIKQQSFTNADTLRLFKDCQSYLAVSTNEPNLCATVLDVAVMSYGGGQIFLMGIIGDEEIQNNIDKKFKEYLFNKAKCRPQDDPVLSYNGGKKIKEVAAKFVENMESHPEWLELKPSDALLSSIFSFYCKK